jgi:hypothetical protein
MARPHPSNTHSDAYLVNPKPNLDTSQSNAARLRYKMNPLCSARERGSIVCFHYDDSGHFASSSRNSLAYFACGKLGHVSSNCRSITMAPQTTKTPTFDELSKANRFSPIIFTSNPINSDFRATLRK